MLLNKSAREAEVLSLLLLGRLNSEPDGTFVGLRLQKRPDSIKDLPDLPIVALKLPLQFSKAMGQLPVRCEDLAQLDEGAHDSDVYLDCPIALQHAR